MNVTFTCAQCGESCTRYQKPSRGEPKFCSQQCVGKATAGKQQTPEHVEKRKRSGEQSHHWKGENINEKSGRCRALRLFKQIGACERCGANKTERHHRDGNTLNNERENISALCRRCHMEADGRLQKFADLNRKEL